MIPSLNWSSQPTVVVIGSGGVSHGRWLVFSRQTADIAPRADESGAPVSMVGALIPQGYELDQTIPGRQWICPVRSCRSACKSRKGLGYHFMVSSNGQEAAFLG